MKQLLWTCMAAAVLASCARGPAGRAGEGLEVSQLDPGVRADYALFANRCSKCHALSRALNSGIDDDDFWLLYVERMRRQPASGISKLDEEGILRFLRYFAAELRRKKAGAHGTSAGPATGGTL